MNRRTILYGALAGALGGALGWLPAELLALPEPTNELIKYGLLALYFALVSAWIGAAIGALDGAINGQREQAVAGARTGALLGAIGGAIGSLPGELAFQALSALGLGLTGRALGWALVGIFIGVAQGVMGRDRVRMVRGGVGGLGGRLSGGRLLCLDQRLVGWWRRQPLAGVSDFGRLLGSIHCLLPALAL